MTRKTLSRATPWTAAIALLAAAAIPAAAQEPKPEVHPDFQQIIPRGRIASVDRPQFVSAKKAEISGDAWILGVAIGGQARAYSLNLLNRHEIVNDRIGDRSFAAVW